MVYPCVEESDGDSVEDRLSSIYSQENRQWEHIKKKNPIWTLAFSYEGDWITDTGCPGRLWSL